jgi:hypothetical protein
MPDLGNRVANCFEHLVKAIAIGRIFLQPPIALPQKGVPPFLYLAIVAIEDPIGEGLDSFGENLCLVFRLEATANTDAIHDRSRRIAKAILCLDLQAEAIAFRDRDCRRQPQIQKHLRSSSLK